MGDCRYDTGPLGRRNRFRPVLRHETTGRGTNSGGRLAGEAIRGGIQAAAMTAAGKQARRRKTIKQKIVHGIQENGMNYRKTISSMIVRPAKREAGMGDRETIDRLIVRLVRREAGAGRGASRRNSYIRRECGLGDVMRHPPPGETHIKGERFRCAITISTTRGFTTSSAIRLIRLRWMSVKQISQFYDV